MATANQIRQVGLEVSGNISTVKATVDALKTAVDAIHTVTSGWTLNSVDGDLPTDLAVKEQLAAYNSLVVAVNKPSTSLDDAVSAVNQAA